MGIKKDIDDLVDALYSAGKDGKKIATRLIEAGLKMMEEEGDSTTALALVLGQEIEPDDAFFLSLDSDGQGFTIETVQNIAPETIRTTLKTCAETFADYAGQHRAKSPPQVEKAERNEHMAALCLAALGEPADTVILPSDDRPTGLEDAKNRLLDAQEHDSALPASDHPSEHVVVPVAAIKSILGDLMDDDDFHIANDRIGHAFEAIDQLLDKALIVTDADIPAYIRTKAVAARAHAKKNTAGAATDFSHYAKMLDCLAEEIERGLHEEAKTDHAEALRAFFKDVHGRNVKAGWWNDLATGQPKKRSVGELFMLFVTEIAEAYDAWAQNAPDDKLTQYPGLGVELADLGIRWADFCGAMLAGRIVAPSGVRNPGDAMFQEVVAIAHRYEAIRKTPEAVGQPEEGDALPAADVSIMVDAKLDYNATRADHKIENRLKDDGKRT